MEFGLFLMPLHPPDRLHSETYDEDLELVSYADQLGFSETWIGEHYTLPWENMPSPELFIARALGVTEQMALGTGVVLLHYHDPVHVAHRIAMVDQMAKGRFFFGIGAGGAPTDTEMFGVDTEAGSLRDRMLESIDIILKLWEGEPFKYKGKFFNATLPEPVPEARLGFHMTPYQKPHPPIAVAGSSPYSATLEIVGERGWWPMSTLFLHTKWLASHWEAVEKGASRTGQKMSRKVWRISREVHVAETTQKAREEAMAGPMGRHFIEYWTALMSSTPRGLSALKYDPDLPDEAITPEYMLDQFWIVGDPDEVTRKIRKLYDDVGGFGVLLPLCHDWGRNRDQWYRSMELMTKEVQPALADLDPD